MATANFGEGAVFEISDDIVRQMGNFDQHLERIAKSSGKINASPFQKLVDAVNGLKVDNVQSLERLAAAMDKLSGASGASQSLNNVAHGAQNVGTSASSANTSLSQTAQLLNQLSVSHPFNTLADGTQRAVTNITLLKAEIADINSRLTKQGQTYTNIFGEEQTYKILTAQEQQQLVNRRNLLQQELKIQQASSEAQISAIKRVSDVQNADTILQEKLSNQRIAQARKEYAERAKLSQQQNYKQNTTYQGALNFSSTANTLQRQITAIGYLKEARKQLNTTDADYKIKLDALNQAIKRHEDVLRQAGVMSQQLQGHHRNLMDISGQLARQFALLFSVSQVEGYISQIAKVRGEFELQQRSLEAILQNKTEADAIFQKTVDLAIKSPFQIKELVSYTKQLAAYRIEGDKLYDTTKRLADVSAGLGVNMQRLILAYGQVKAAAYLRGTEVRQFTEAGVNMYGELQSYFQEVKGEAYTTAQIVDMISKRKVTFEDVEAVFQRLTSQGGLFYNMQEIQSETLNGKIANLKDSFDVMMNSIGKDPLHEWELKGTIDLTRTLLDHWQAVATVIAPLAGAIAAFAIKAGVAKVASSGIAKSWAATLVQIKATNGLLSKTKILLSSMKTGLIGAGIMVGALALDALISKIMEANRAAKEYNKTMAENRVKIDTIGYDFDTAKGDKQQSLFDKQKTQLKKLQEEAARQSIHIESMLDDVTEENIQDVFHNAQRTVQQIQDTIALSARVDTKAGNSNDDYEDFKGFADDLITSSANMDAALNTMLFSTQKEIEAQKQILAGSDKLSENEKKRHEATLKSLEERSTKLFEIQKIELNGANDIYSYMLKAQKLADVAAPLGITAGDISGRSTRQALTFTAPDGDEVNVYKEYLNDVVNSSEDAQSSINDFKDGWVKAMEAAKSAHGDWFANLSSTDKKVKETAELTVRNWAEGFASGDKWTEAGRAAFFKVLEAWINASHKNEKGFSFKVRPDMDDTKEQLQSLTSFLKSEFDKQSYTIRVGFSYDSLGDKNIGKDIQSEAKRIAESAKNAKDLADQLERSTRYKGKMLNQKQLNLSDQEWMDMFGSMVTEVSTDQAIKGLRDYAKANEQEATAQGYRDKKADDKRKNAAAKAERDIWSERISVLKEMQQQYEKVREHYGEDTAKAITLSEYMPTLTDVNIGAIIKPEDIVPTKQGIVDALEKALSAMPKTLKDYKKKSWDLQKTIHDLKLEIHTEEAQKKLEETKKYVEHLFDGLDLHQKLKDAGLSEAEVQALFPGLAKTLDEVQIGLNSRYSKLKEKSGGVLGEAEQKAYDEQTRQLNEKRIKQQQDTVIELTKAYKTQLSEQLQLDKWYYEQKALIASTNLTDEQKTSYTANLDTQYKQKSADNEWKAFKGSDTYLNIFSGDLDNISTSTLEKMKTTLDNLKTSLKELDPANLREITDLYKKIEDVTSERSPFAALLKDLKEIKKLKSEGWTEDKLNAEIMNNDAQIIELESVNETINKFITLKNLKSEYLTQEQQIQNLIGQSEYAGMSIEELQAQLGVSTDDAEVEKITNLINLYTQLNNIKIAGKQVEQQIGDLTKTNSSYADNSVSELNSELDANKKIAKELKNKNSKAQEGLNTYSKSRKDTQKLAEQWQQLVQEMQSAWSSIQQVMEATGNDDSTAGMVATIVLQLAAATVQAILFGLAMKSAMGIIGIILIAIEAIASVFATIIGNHDKSLQEEIENYQRMIDALSNAYDELSDKMDAAWNVQQLQSYNKQMEANLKAQNQYLNSMIAAEMDKKDSDQDKIDEWTEQINENLKTIQENLENVLEAAGGLGSDSNWQSAMQDFADAWVDAFNEGESSIDALNDSFNDLIENMVKKQAMLRVVSKMLEPLLEEIDKAVDENGAGGMKVLKEELDAIKSKWAEISPELNETLTSLMETLEVAPSNSSELSALQQGIESISETSAEALEALLNSIRFFLATQQGDVAIIRSLLELHFGTVSSATVQTSPTTTTTKTSSSNPMLTELKTQTGYLKQMAENFEDCFTYNSNSNGKGLRVYVKGL